MKQKLSYKVGHSNPRGGEESQEQAQESDTHSLSWSEVP